jgi:DNA transformation protein and related proteins
MKNNSFKDFVLEQLADLSGVTCKSMFGGFGLYCEGRFFGVIADEQVFFKTDKTTRQKYEELGMKPFAPTPEQVLKNYYEVPAEVLESPEEFKTWALEASHRNN